jgi:hypothetical protein
MLGATENALHTAVVQAVFVSNNPKGSSDGAVHSQIETTRTQGD